MRFPMNILFGDSRKGNQNAKLFECALCVCVWGALCKWKTNIIHNCNVKQQQQRHATVPMARSKMCVFWDGKTNKEFKFVIYLNRINYNIGHTMKKGKHFVSHSCAIVAITNLLFNIHHRSDETSLFIRSTNGEESHVHVHVHHCKIWDHTSVLL